MKFKRSILIILFLISNHLGFTSHTVIEISDYNGEEMFYNLRYGFFNIGKATISFKDTTSCNSYIKAEASSTGISRIFFTIHYLYDCCMDPVTGLPNKITRSLLENDFFEYNEVIFDHQTRNDSSIIYSQLSGKKIVPKNILDILTGFYYFRRNHIQQCSKNKNDVVIQTYFTDDIWDLRIRYAGKEIINSVFGDVECYVFKPETVIGRFFRHDDDMTVWFTDDEYCIPVRIRLNLKIGAITGDLVGYKGVVNK